MRVAWLCQVLGDDFLFIYDERVIIVDQKFIYVNTCRPQHMMNGAVFSDGNEWFPFPSATHKHTLDRFDLFLSLIDFVD